MDLNNKALCVMPWMHLYIESSGNTLPCCLTTGHNYILGNINYDSIETIWNSEQMKMLRKQMLSGDPPKICDRCSNREISGQVSKRLEFNKIYNKVIEKIPYITEDDGHVTEIKLMYWDFRASNLCNLKCRSCSPRFSTSWVQDAKKLNHYGPALSEQKILKVDPEKYQFYKNYLTDVDRIHFAGGEPLYMPEHYDMLDELIKQKKFDVVLEYNTNCMVIEHNGKNVLDYWKQWNKKTIKIMASIDEIDDRLELVRSGAKFDTIVKNIKIFNSIEAVQFVAIQITVGALNVFRLPEIIKKMIDVGIIDKKHGYLNFILHPIMDPSHYTFSVLPDNFKKEIEQKILLAISLFKEQYGVDMTGKFKFVLSLLNEPHNEENSKRFLVITSEVDQVRNEDTLRVIPELNIIKEIYGTKKQ
jgi:radical SAM protein with 4Fe4S-binding SPASM domain